MAKHLGGPLTTGLRRRAYFGTKYPTFVGEKRSLYAFLIPISFYLFYIFGPRPPPLLDLWAFGYSLSSLIGNQALIWSYTGEHFPLKILFDGEGGGNHKKQVAWSCNRRSHCAGITVPYSTVVQFCSLSTNK